MSFFNEGFVMALVLVVCGQRALSNQREIFGIFRRTWGGGGILLRVETICFRFLATALSASLFHLRENTFMLVVKIVDIN